MIVYAWCQERTWASYDTTQYFLSFLTVKLAHDWLPLSVKSGLEQVMTCWFSPALAVDVDRCNIRAVILYDFSIGLTGSDSLKRLLCAPWDIAPKTSELYKKLSFQKHIHFELSFRIWLLGKELYIVC